jgi:hypothetical protein
MADFDRIPLDPTHPIRPVRHDRSRRESPPRRPPERERDEEGRPEDSGKGPRDDGKPHVDEYADGAGGPVAQAVRGRPRGVPAGLATAREAAADLPAAPAPPPFPVAGPGPTADRPAGPPDPAPPARRAP